VSDPAEPVSSTDDVSAPSDWLDKPHSRATFLAGAGALAATAALGGLASTGNAARIPVKRSARGGTLVVATESVGASFVPADSFQGWGHLLAENHLYDSLYTNAGGDATKPLVPGLASGPPTGTKNGLEYIVPLRRNVKFHDGTPFNAEAVEFAFMRHIDKSHPYWDPATLWVGTYLLRGVTKVEAVDTYKVKFTLSQPLGSFIGQLVAFGGIMSPTSVKKLGVANAGLTPVGTGPFSFAENVKGDHTTLQAFDGYWGGRPNIDRLVIRAIPDPQALTASLLAGEVDVTQWLSFQDLASFRKNSRFNVGLKPSVITGYMGLNSGIESSVKTFEDLRVRQAALMSVDKRKLIQLIFQGFASPGAGVNPVPSWGYQKEFVNYYKHDPAKARALLKAAGAEGRKVRISTQSTGYWPRMAEVIQSDMKDAGFDASIEQLDTSVFYGRMTQGRHDLFIGDGTPLLFQPFILYSVFYGCSNALRGRWGGWCEPQFDKAVTSAAASRDRVKAKKLIRYLDKTLLDRAVYQTNYYPTMSNVTGARVVGFKPQSSRLFRLEGVSLK
jgi:peptide/nickel transport system substrate-binding protein